MARKKAIITKSSSKSKYKNIRFTVVTNFNGQSCKLKFDSKKEMNRGLELIKKQDEKIIHSLEFQKKFVVVPKQDGEREASYICDAFYFDNVKNKWIVEDTKSERTRKLQSYVLKRKLVKYQNKNIEFLEV